MANIFELFFAKKRFLDQLRCPLFHDTVSTDCKKMKKDVEMRGIEPRAFHMQSERSATELHPRCEVPQ